jgi:hypothetical protein
MNHQASHHGGGRRPQPTTLAGLFPARLIDVFDGRVLHRLPRRRMGHRQGGAHLLFQVGYRSQANRQAHNGFDQFLDATLADMGAAAQIRHQRGQLRSVGVGTHVVGNFGPGDGAAATTGAAVGLVFGDFDRPRRQLGYLMPNRLRIISRRLGGQGSLTVSTPSGNKVDDFFELVGRPAQPQIPGMAGLPTRLTAGGFFDDRLGRVRWVGRRRQRGIGGIDAQARLEFAHQGLQLGHTALQLPTALTFRLWHSQSLAEARRHSCASFYRVNGYSNSSSDSGKASGHRPET